MGQLVGDHVHRGLALLLGGGVGVEQQQDLPEGDAPHVLHGPEGEVGDGHQIELVPGVIDGEVVLEEAEAERPGVQGVLGEVALANWMDDAQRCAVHIHRLGGLQRADDEGQQVGGHLHGGGEGHRPPTIGGGVGADLGSG